MAKLSMAGGKDNSFINLRDGAAGHVLLKLHENKLGKEEHPGGYYGRVSRFTFSNQNVLDRMAGELPDMTTGRITDVMTAYIKVLLDVLGAGYAVRFGALGTFYIAPVGLAANPGEKLPLTVRFSPDRSLLDSVSKVQVSDSILALPQVEFGRITDVNRAASDGLLTAGGVVLVEGDGLRIGGEGSGLWLAPEGSDGAADSDEGSWVKVSTFQYNLPKKLMFTLPAGMIAGRYVLVLRTKCAGNKRRFRKEMLEGVSEGVLVQESGSI